MLKFKKNYGNFVANRVQNDFNFIIKRIYFCLSTNFDLLNYIWVYEIKMLMYIYILPPLSVTAKLLYYCHKN